MPLVDNAWYVNGGSAISVVDLGSVNNSSGATLTTTLTVPAGALLVAVVHEATAVLAGTMADATNGSWTLATSQAEASGIGQIFYFANSASLSAITLTYTKKTSGDVATLSVFYATGMATSTPLDSGFTTTTTSTSATPTLTSNAAAGKGELVLGAICYNSSPARTYTQPAAVPFFTPPSGSTTQITAQLGGGTMINYGTATVTFAPTLGGTTTSAALMLVAFKPATTPANGYNVVTAWAASASKVTGNIVRQNISPVYANERCFVCVASTGGTGTTGSTEPAWTVTRGGKTTDNTVTWQEATGIAALNGDLSINTPNWNVVKNTAIVLGQVIQNVAGTLILICTTAGTAGNGAEPSWAAFTNAGATTVDNGATWTTLGASFSAWASPHSRLANAVAANWGQAGNAFYIGNTYAEVTQTNILVTFPGTPGSPNFTYCVNSGGSVPPVSADLRTTGTMTAQIATGNAIIVRGSSYIYGLTITSPATWLVQGGANVTFWQVYEACSLVLAKTSGTDTLGLGIGGNFGNYVKLLNTTVSFGAVGQAINLWGIRFIWQYTSSAIIGAAVPTNLISPQVAQLIEMTGVDLSAMGSGKTIFGSTINPCVAILKDCKLGASVTVAATPTAPGCDFDLIRSDSSGTNYRQEKYVYAGTLTAENTIVRTGGATDGTTPISWKVVTTSNSKWLLPFESYSIAIWNNTTGSGKTVTVYGTTTGGGVPNNDDIWIEVEYLGDSSSPQASFQTTTKANNLAASTTTNNSSDASTWGGAGAGNGFKMVTPSFTPQQKGYFNVTVKVAKVSSTFYVDPLVIIT